MAFDLAGALRSAAPGALVAVPAGTWPANLLIEKSVTLVAMGTVALDGRSHGAVVRVVAPGGTVKLAGFLLAGGDSPQGAGVEVQAGQVELLECTFRHNHAPLNGGGALYVGGDAQVTATRCRFEGNTGRQGGAILVDGLGQLTLADSTVVQNAAVLGGGLRVREGAQVQVTGCTLADNKVVGEGASGGALHVGGSSTRAPKVTVSHCIISERAEGAPCLGRTAASPGQLVLERDLLPAWCAGEGGDNRFGAPGYALLGSEPYQLKGGSPALGAGRPDFFPPGAKDLTGRPRVVGTAAPTLGALVAPR